MAGSLERASRSRRIEGVRSVPATVESVLPEGDGLRPHHAWRTEAKRDVQLSQTGETKGCRHLGLNLVTGVGRSKTTTGEPLFAEVHGSVEHYI